MENKLYVVIPCYNEEEVLPETSKRLKNKLEELMEKGKIDRNSKIVFVNDGSKDRTWEIVEKLHEEDHIFSGINLSRNRGHQNALLAGLMTAKNYADMVVSMDADLQDDINAVDEMVEKYLNGIDIVYGVRSSRAKDTFFKKATAEGFYKLMNGMGANTVFNHADYRLMSRRALEGLAQFGEVNLFLRGIVPMIGYRTDVVYYDRMITGLGFFVFLVSLIILVYSFVRHFMGATIVGWTTLMVSVWAIGGLILLSLGVVGEYIGKIYLETKARPRFLIDEFLNEEDEE